jgi:hypothetical protein
MSYQYIVKEQHMIFLKLFHLNIIKYFNGTTYELYLIYLTYQWIKKYL